MKRHKSKKITQSAKGQDCTLRIFGVCNFDPKTTVFAHMNGGGMGTKHSDIHGCYSCSSCHDWLDSRFSRHTGNDRLPDRMVKDSEFLRAMVETQNILLEQGLIKI